ncbi:MAG: UDP-3-O-(3-hydroxymyristoyl)glucosamine N-acyltransferase [Gammaproteobacteria bacterium]|jgi:UDP-3-O-[3-hydroxymyristoyl] glucosamine N-acyltransferase|nr:UDP-3-O-(3-hydroxymyristoyl)glucosamine N-acyltransferase [Gammaproteobacteria bacterium]
MTATVKELAALCGAELIGGDPDARIRGAANVDEADAGQLTFIAGARHAAKLDSTRATAVIVPRALADRAGNGSAALLAVDDPEIAFIVCLRRLHPETRPTGAISDRADIAASASVGAESSVGAFATIGERAMVGERCVLHAGCRVGNDASIGDDCVLHPNVVLYDGVVLGDRVVVHAGAVIGSDGFGYKFRGGAHVKFPQVGSVAIGSDVEIGANTCIDRAALGVTRVGDGTKIDNQVHIAHNVRVGAHALLLGQVGIGGSTVIGDYAILASQSGVSDHVTVGAQAMVLAQAGVTKDVAPKDQVMGFPAANRREALHEMAALRRVAEHAKALDELVKLLPTLRDAAPRDD